MAGADREVALPPSHRSAFSFGFFSAPAAPALAAPSAATMAGPVVAVAVVDPRAAAWADLPARAADAPCDGTLRSVEDASAAATQSSLVPLLDGAGTDGTDIIPGVYEGGLKEWEASHDLVRYVESASSGLGALSALRVLELGCGHGLPGIAALRRGAAVAFTDLNVEVLTSATLPNALLNAWRARVDERAFFVSGDWASSELLERLLGWAPAAAPSAASTTPATASGKFSLILSAETVYTSEALHALHALILRTLAPGGVALCAAKRYYFGLGGGTRALCDHAAAAGQLHARVVAVTEERNVVREIVELRF